MDSTHEFFVACLQDQVTLLKEKVRELENKLHRKDEVIKFLINMLAEVNNES